MTDHSAVFEKNLALEIRASDTASCIRSSQISELYRLIKNDKHLCSPTQIADIFQKQFNKDPLCAEMLLLSDKIVADMHTRDTLTKKKAMIALMSNPLSLGAVKKLEVEIPSIKLLPQSDFRSTCEAVVSDQADYCILPFCSSVDGYYQSFFRFMRSYDLKICRLVRIAKTESDEEVDLALMSKKFELNDQANNLIFSITDSDSANLSKLIFALLKCKIEITAINSEPLEFNMDMLSHRISVKLTELSLNTILYFLEAALPGHTVLGIY